MMFRQFHRYFGFSLLIVFTIGVCSTAPAEQNSASDKSGLTKQTTAASESELQQAKQQVLALSASIVETIRLEGITAETIKKQKKLDLVLSQLLKQSTPHRQPHEPDSPSGTQASEETVDEPENQQSPEMSGNAGRAPGSSDQNAENPAPLKIREKLADSVWGHLPPQERDDLIRTYSDSYLPGYENQVRSYFEQLAKLQRRTISNKSDRTPKDKSKPVE